MKNYTKDMQKKYPNAKITLQKFNTSAADEAKMIEKMVDINDNKDPSPGFCTSTCIDTTEDIEPFESGVGSMTMQPTGLMNDLKDLNPDSTTTLPSLNESK